MCPLVPMPGEAKLSLSGFALDPKNPTVREIDAPKVAGAVERGAFEKGVHPGVTCGEPGRRLVGLVQGFGQYRENLRIQMLGGWIHADPRVSGLIGKLDA